MYVCMHVCMYVCMHVCMYVRMYVCMYVCMYVRTYACMYVCMFVCLFVSRCVCMPARLRACHACMNIHQFPLHLNEALRIGHALRRLNFSSSNIKFLHDGNPHLCKQILGRRRLMCQLNIYIHRGMNVPHTHAHAHTHNVHARAHDT